MYFILITYVVIGLITVLAVAINEKVTRPYEEPFEGGFLLLLILIWPGVWIGVVLLWLEVKFKLLVEKMANKLCK